MMLRRTIDGRPCSRAASMAARDWAVQKSTFQVSPVALTPDTSGFARCDAAQGGTPVAQFVPPLPGRNPHPAVRVDDGLGPTLKKSSRYFGEKESLVVRPVPPNCWCANHGMLPPATSVSTVV